MRHSGTTSGPRSARTQPRSLRQPLLVRPSRPPGLIRLEIRISETWGQQRSKDKLGWASSTRRPPPTSRAPGSPARALLLLKESLEFTADLLSGILGTLDRQDLPERNMDPMLIHRMLELTTEDRASKGVL